MVIRRLKDLIKYHKIPLPADLASDPFVQSPQATIELVGYPNQQIRAHMPPPETYFPGAFHFQQPGNILSSSDLSYNTLHSGSTTSSSDIFSSLTVSEGPSSLHAPSIYSQAASSAPPIPPIAEAMPHPQGLGTTQVGVDFVLALEHVCLEHHAHPATADDATGHEMMLMSPIMWHSPGRQQHMGRSSRSGPGSVGIGGGNKSPPPSSSTEPQKASNPLLPAGTTRWNVPALELEKLLDFSDKLSLDGEITPVEAWQRIRQHPNFEGMSRDSLDALKETLLPEVTCYG